VKVKAWLITLVIISSVLFGLYIYKYDTIYPSAQAASTVFEPAATVESIETRFSSFQKTAKVPGSVKAPQQLMLKNELSGVITELLFSSGEIVDKGQVLLRLDVSNEEAALEAEKARLVLSEQTLKRYKKLLAKSEISADLVDQAAANLSIAQSNVKQLITTINKKTIKAPFKAVVGLHNLTIGQYLEGNSTISQLVGTSSMLWVEFSLPQSIPELAIGEQVVIKTVGGQSTYANVIALNPVLTDLSRHLKYRAQFESSKSAIKPNALVNVTAPVGKSTNRIIVPDLSLTHDQFGDYVFVLTPENNEEGSYRAKRKQVTLALKNEQQVVIESGLEAGQLVATTGAFKLRDGMKVFIAQTQQNN